MSAQDKQVHRCLSQAIAGPVERKSQSCAFNREVGKDTLHLIELHTAQDVLTEGFSDHSHERLLRFT